MNSNNSIAPAFEFSIESSGPELHVALGENDPITFDSANQIREAVDTLYDAVHEMERLDGTRAKQDALIAQAEAEETAARATACGVEGCTGDIHEPGVAPEDWEHFLPELFFDPAVSVQIIVTSDKKHARGFIQYEAASSVTAAELRAEADTFEAYPAWLREQADKIDALSN